MNLAQVFSLKWCHHFIALARLAASMSKDRSTKCGCVLVGANRNVISTGYNGLPRGMNDDIDSRHERPQKYAYFEHAERNAIFNAARHGIALEDTVAFVTGPPCVDCTRALIQSGVQAVYIPEHHNFTGKEVSDRWRESTQIAQNMMKECGIFFEVVHGI